ncbi:MAG: trehalose-phosphatase, partial [Pseudomonadota bacterium]
LAALVRADGVIYVGAHGFDIRGASLEPPKIHGAEELRHEFGSAARELRDRLAGIRGALVEDKRFAVAVHYRLVDEAERHLVEAAAKEVIGLHPSLRRTDGKMVIELRPRIDWDKGKAVLWLSEAVGLDRRTALPICVGDDTTDEDAFAAVRNHGLGIVVAEKPRPTAAHYRLPDTGSVIRFLQTLATAIEARDG